MPLLSDQTMKKDLQDFILILFLVMLSSFVPNWLDTYIAGVVTGWNAWYLYQNWERVVPLWAVALVVVQIMGLASGWYTDHDPLEGHWGGTDTSRGHKEDWL